MNVGIGIEYYCNYKGERTFPNNYYYRYFNNSDKTFIKHFTKTIEEFCNKLKSGDAHYGANFLKYSYQKVLNFNK